MKHWKSIAKITVFCLGVIAFLVLTIASNQKERFTNTNDITVEIENPELQFVDAFEIKKSILNNNDSIEFVSIRQLNLQEIEQTIEQNEFVENCEAFINNKKSLGLRIQQKQPLFRVLHQNGVSYYVDKSGIKFPKSSKFTANVPVVGGTIVYDVDSLGVQQSKSINDLMQFVEFTATNEMVKALVSSIDVEANGDLIITPRVGKHLINIGSANNLEEKFNRLFIFYKEGLNKIGWDQYDEINLKFKDQIIAKKKE